MYIRDDRRIEVKENAEFVKNVQRMCLSHIESKSRHEKTVRALGAAFTHVRPKTKTTRPHTNLGVTV